MDLDQAFSDYRQRQNQAITLQEVIDRYRTHCEQAEPLTTEEVIEDYLTQSLGRIVHVVRDSV